MNNDVFFWPGDLCKICHETGRRAYPNMRRDQLIEKMAEEDFMSEFTDSILDLALLLFV